MNRIIFLLSLIVILLLTTSCLADTGCRHDFGSFAVEKVATCTEAGLMTRTCALCGETETASVDCLPHKEEVLQEKAPSCLEPGLSEGKRCSDCGTLLVLQTELPILAHTPVTVNAEEPTCTKTGKTESSYCSLCNTVLQAAEELPVKEHVYQKTTVSPTCGTQGYTEYRCTCGDTYQENVKPATGNHSFKLNANLVGYSCATCKLQVCEYGNADGSMAGGNNKVKYYITGPISEVSIPRTLVICGSGKMPDFSSNDLPMWYVSTYIYDVTSIVIEEGITGIGKYCFNKSKYENPYENVTSFIIRNTNLRVSAGTDPLTGIKCKVKYE